jgi:hypothetical protein
VELLPRTHVSIFARAVPASGHTETGSLAMHRFTIAAAALTYGFAAASPALAARRVDAPAPYVKVCSLVAAAHVGVAPELVLPGPSFAAPRGLVIKLLAGGVPMSCHISNGFTVLGVWYG